MAFFQATFRDSTKRASDRTVKTHREGRTESGTDEREDPSVGPSIHRSIDPSIRRSVDLSIHRSVDTSVRRSVDLSIRRPVGPPIHPITVRPNPRVGGKRAKPKRNVRAGGRTLVRSRARRRPGARSSCSAPSALYRPVPPYPVPSKSSWSDADQSAASWTCFRY